MLKKVRTFRSTFTLYTANDVVGEGGAGIVYQVTDEESNPFAVKVVKPENVTRDRLKRFKNELRFCQENRHPNILTVLDHGFAETENKPSPFYVMPLYDGSLRSLMAKPIPSDRLVRFVDQLLDGLEAAHLKGVVHRDFKPENVLLDSKNDRLLLADFGIARFRQEELFTLVETSSKNVLPTSSTQPPSSVCEMLPSTIAPIYMR